MSATTVTGSSTRVLVYGGSGAMGKAVVTAFKTFGSIVDSVDFVANADATNNYLVSKEFEKGLTSVVKTLETESANLGGMKRRSKFYFLFFCFCSLYACVQ